MLLPCYPRNPQSGKLKSPARQIFTVMKTSNTYKEKIKTATIKAQETGYQLLSPTEDDALALPLFYLFYEVK